MLFYWALLAWQRVQWFFRVPKAEDLAYIDIHAQCPVCGARDGRLRCVLQAKPAIRVVSQLPDGMILCQHICNTCGARWHEQPVRASTPSDVLPSVARTRREQKEDSQARLQAEQPAVASGENRR
jgi:hypothetical protein